MEYALYAIAIYLLLFSVRYILTFLTLAKCQFQNPDYQVIQADQVPAYLRELFVHPIQELQEFGFQPCSYLCYRPMVKTHQQRNWEVLLYHRELKTYATIVTRNLVNPLDLFDIEFYTFFQDKTFLLTFNGKLHGLLGEIPHTIIQDVYTDKLEIQWQAHQNKCQELITSKTLSVFKPSSFAKVLNFYMNNYLKKLVELKYVVATQEARVFQVTWQSALKILDRVVKGNNQLTRINQQRQTAAQQSGTQPLEIPVELEINSFNFMQYVQQDLINKKFRTWLFLGSLALFAASFTNSFNLQSLVIFVVAVFFHEIGHVLAMRLFGYSDSSILFVPFFGALATARKDNATLTQKFWVSLAGPLPGLILGIILAIIVPFGQGDPSWLNETSLILIVLNLFNLLPIYPLDGGKIADLLLFSRFPYLDILFKIFGVIILALTSLNSPMMLIFVVLIALGIPQSFRTAKINSQLQKELRQDAPTDQNSLVYSIFNHLRKLGHVNLPFNTKYTLVKDLIQRYYESAGKWKTRIFLGLIYCFSLIVGTFGSLQAIIPNWFTVLPDYFSTPEQARERWNKKVQAEIDQATAALKTNPNDVNAYAKRARIRMFIGDYQGSLADYNQAVSLKPEDNSLLNQRAYLRSILKDYKGALQDYNQLSKRQPKDLDIYYKSSRLRERIQDYQGAIVDYNTILQLNPQHHGTYLSRGELRLKVKDYKGAYADANSYIKLYPQRPDGYALRSQIRRGLGDTAKANLDEQRAKNLTDKIRRSRSPLSTNE
ncbi:MAG TPA: site-2 protease family protein [Nostocaceae cyanobacterium]|nr:site-2 protease family protein [Nostocaceae cyanobacterium]